MFLGSFGHFKLGLPRARSDNQSVEKTFTYRNGCLFFVAFWFSVLGLIFSLTALHASMTGNQMAVRTASGTLISTGPLSWLPVFMPALAVPIGTWLFLFAVNSKVVLDTDGVRIYNWSRRSIFEAKWDEIVSVHRLYDSRGGYCLCIETAYRKEMVTNSIVGMKELEIYLGDHVGRIDEPTSEFGLPLSKVG